jgi:SAM-dependent methyltransferase
VSIKHFLDSRFYPQLDDDWSSRAYHDFVLRHLRKTDHILDFGAGRGAEPLHGFREFVSRVSAVDVDSAVLENPSVDEAKVLNPDGSIPFADETFDAVVSAYVLEHLPDPLHSFREVRRVLRPGGVFLFMTPNKRHYVPLIAAMTPQWFHVWFNARRGRAERDTFPTVYRANSVDDVRRLASVAGFSRVAIELREGRPEYLRAITPLYPLGIAYERVVNSVPQLAGYRVQMLGALHR